jgi:hypothetical protein
MLEAEEESGSYMVESLSNLRFVYPHRIPQMFLCQYLRTGYAVALFSY